MIRVRNVPFAGTTQRLNVTLTIRNLKTFAGYWSAIYTKREPLALTVAQNIFAANARTRQNARRIRREPFSEFMACYLLHFSEPLAHARHYAGFAESDVYARLQQHQQGRGARITQVAAARGIVFQLVRVWKSADRKFERKLKDGSLTEHCPLCRAESVRRKSERQRQRRANRKRHDTDCSL